MIPTLFREKKVNKTLKKKGFVRLPFLSTSAVESLRLAFMGHKQSIGEGFCATMFSDDMEYRQWANEIICQALNAGFHRTLPTPIPSSLCQLYGKIPR